MDSPIRRDLCKESEIYLKDRLDQFNLEEIYDNLIKNSVVPSNFTEVLECAFRWCRLKDFQPQDIILGKYLDKENAKLNNFFDYLDCISTIHYIVGKRSYMGLYA